MDSRVAAAWIGVIPSRAGLLFVVIVVTLNRERLQVLLTRITRANVAGVQVELATDELRNARPAQPVTERSATLLEARIAPQRRRDSRSAGPVGGRRPQKATMLSGGSCAPRVCGSRTWWRRRRRSAGCDAMTTTR